MGRDEELRMTYSGLLMKDGEKMVRVSFERGKKPMRKGLYQGVLLRSLQDSAKRKSKCLPFTCKTMLRISLIGQKVLTS